MKISINKIFGFIMLSLYFIIAFVSIQSDFASILRYNGSYSDGIFYLALDVILLIYCIEGSRVLAKSSSKFVIPMVMISAYQLLAICISGSGNVLLLIMRGMTWSLIILSIYLYLTYWPSNQNYTINIFVFFLLILSLEILNGELNVRNITADKGINIIYWVELGLPVIFFLKNKIVKWSMVIILGITVFLSLKATAIIAFFVPLFVGLLIQYRMETGKIYKGIIFAIISFIVIYFALPSVLSSLNTNYGIDWLLKLNYSYDSGGSGRMKIWGDVISLQKESDLLQWLFGHGYEGVIKSTGNLSAHNDFLEILFDYGLIGFGLYLSMIISLIRTARNKIRVGNSCGIVLVASIVQFLILSVFSHLVIYPRLLMTIGVIWGICIAENDGDDYGDSIEVEY